MIAYTLTKKEKVLVQEYLYDIMNHINDEYGTWFEPIKYSFDTYGEKCASLLMRSYNPNERKSFNIYYKLKNKKVINGLYYYIGFSSNLGIEMKLYFQRDDFNKLIRKEKLKKLNNEK